jgi:hypothetical protein
MTKEQPLPEKKAVQRTVASDVASPQLMPSQTDPGSVVQRAQIDPHTLSPNDVLHLQRSIGNHAVGQLLSNGESERRQTPSIQRAPEGNTTPPAITPAPQTANTIQRVVVPMPKRVQLTGGNGVSVLWKKSKKSDVPHVTVAHGVFDPKTNTIPINNFHYKTGGYDYFHWDDPKTGKLNFKFRGGSPTKGVYTETVKQARKFGISLERPSNLPEEQAPQPVVSQPISTPTFESEEEFVDNWTPPSERGEEQEQVTPQQDQGEVPESWEEMLGDL